MPESTAEASGAGNSFLPWHLIPVFKPGLTDLTEYSRKLQFLAQMWPQEHLSQLAPRAALLCEGSAFQKLVRIDATKLKMNDTKGVELLVSTLGESGERRYLKISTRSLRKQFTLPANGLTKRTNRILHDMRFCSRTC